MTECPGKEHETNNPLPTGRVWEGVWSPPESFTLASMLAEPCAHHHEGPWVSDWPKTIWKLILPSKTHSHVWMWELDHEKGWAWKNWCLWTVVLKKTLESPLDCKEIQPVNPKGNQFWIFIGRSDAEAEAPILWPLDAKSQLIGKDACAGKDWGQEEKGTIENEMVGWHHRLNRHEFKQAPGNGERQGSLACCSPRGSKESNTAKWLNSSNNIKPETSSHVTEQLSWVPLPYRSPWASQVVLVVKNPPANAGDVRKACSIPGSGRSPGGGHGNPF